MSRSTLRLASASILLVTLAACSSDSSGVDATSSFDSGPASTSPVTEPVATEPVDTEPDTTESITTEPDDTEADGSFVEFPELGCTQEDLSGGEAGYTFTSAYLVVGGELGDLCFGREDDVILDAWRSLAAITPAGQLGDLGIFAGFEPDGDAEADTLAYVNSLDADGQQFQMSINTVQAQADEDELLLTLAHEFSHVFTQTDQQLDRTDEAIDSCTTYFNGEGCFLPDSLIQAWIEQFWDPDMLADVDPMAASDADVEARCSVEEGFLGSYAASSPEEDFAEAFSAMVFRLEPATDGQAARFAWLEEQPGLVEFRDRADAEGLTPLDNNFDVCGG